MIEGNINCHNCMIKNSCPLIFLRPEWLTDAQGTVVTRHIPIRNDICRHSTCANGIRAAREAMLTKEASEYLVYAPKALKKIKAVAFGSFDKPTEEKELRIVDVETGMIYSNQDGIYFPTGQIVVN